MEQEGQSTTIQKIKISSSNRNTNGKNKRKEWKMYSKPNLKTNRRTVGNTQ
jgi:hypothetical protein